VSTLPLYRVRAQNTAADSENKIHDDRVAGEYGFRGGLVPGVTVYGYMTAPLVEFAPDWLERGSMQVRFLEPFYDGDEVIVRADANGDGSVRIIAEREDGGLCGSATALLQAPSPRPAEEYPERALPEHRPIPTRDNLIPGTLLGTVVEKLETAEPRQLLQFSNEILARNFRLDPWIHVASKIVNWSATHPGDTIAARGRIHDRFDRKGHEFVVLDVMLIANGNRLVQAVRHTAIYRPRRRD
jgi:acyl dehydratase